jgi:DNA-binding NtrC family response regulator
VTERTSTVLVVDADPATAQAALDALPSGLHRVLAVVDAHQALATLGAQRVDVLVSELVLPEESGLHLLVEVRRLHPHVARVVASAAHDFDLTVAAINEAEVFRFLRKPVDAVVLRAAVEEALARADATHEARGARNAAERRRNALLDLESDHPGISVVPSGTDGYFIPRHRLQGVGERLRGTAVGQALAHAIATRGDAPTP